MLVDVLVLAIAYNRMVKYAVAISNSYILYNFFRSPIECNKIQGQLRLYITLSSEIHSGLFTEIRVQDCLFHPVLSELNCFKELYSTIVAI